MATEKAKTIKVKFNRDYRFAPNSPADRTVVSYKKDVEYELDAKFIGLVDQKIATLVSGAK